MRVFEGNFSAKDVKIGIVAARFNEFITSKLLSGALDALKRHEIADENIDVAWVPGAFEIPLIAKKMAASKKYDAVICLGAVIRGSTTHYDYVCSEVSKGIAHISLDSEIPVMFGVLTTENIEQAIERAGTKAGNKGHENANGTKEVQEENAEQSKSVTQIYDEIKALNVLPEMLDMDAEYISNYYDIDAEKLSDYVFATSLASIKVDTVIIASVKDSADLEDIRLKIQNFREAKAAEMKSYLVDQYDIVEKSDVKTKGNTVYLVISEKSEDIEKIIDSGIK